MRNLKRVLSLALASVMLLGMMVIGAGAADKTAADLTDMDKVTNKEAVSVMVDLGIIEGKPDGSFAPTEGVDRATMAKLITYVLMGDVDAAIFEGTSTDLTDIDTNWAEGYIKYCYANGIISGDGQGHFFPTQGVTVVQAAKMLLVALGYNADNRGYQNNSNWSVNIMKDAQTKGLLNGVNAKATDTLTRDGAAQMIFNTLFATTVTPNYQWDMGTQYIQNYTEGSKLVLSTFGQVVRVTGKVTSVNGTANTIVLESNDTHFNGTYALTSVSADLIGQTVALYAYYTSVTDAGVYTLKKNTDSNVVTTGTAVVADLAVNYGPMDGAVVNQYLTKDSTGKTLLKDSETTLASVIGTNDAVTIYVNGKAVSGKSINDYAKAGYEVTFVSNAGTKVIDSVKVTEKKVAVLADKGTLVVTTPATATEGEKKTISALGITAVETSKIVGLENVVNGGVVLYYKDEVSGIWYIDAAETVTGKITSTKNIEYFIDGVGYTVSALNGSKTEEVAAKADGTFYLDDFSHIVAFKGESTAETAYCQVVAYGKTGSDQSIGGSVVYQATLVFMDGTSETVELTDALSGATAGSGFVATGDFYSYEIKSTGKYELKKVEAADTDAGTSAVDADVTVTAGVPKIGSTAFVVTNDKTVFVVRSGAGTSSDPYAYTAYTGYKNVPSMTDATVKAVVNNETAKVASYVYVTGGSAVNTADTSSKVVLLDGSPVVTYDTPKAGINTYTYDAVVDGVVTTISYEGSAAPEDAGDSALTAGKVYSVSMKDGVALSFSEPFAGTAMGSATATEGVFGFTATAINNGAKEQTAYTYDGSEVVYLIKDGELTVTNMDGLVAAKEALTSGDYKLVLQVAGTDTAANSIALKTVWAIYSGV